MNSPRRPGFARPPQEPRVIDKTLKYRDRDEHLLRRLASALIIHWDTLPDELQDLIIDQAAKVDDRDEADHETRDIENFIRASKLIPLKQPPPTPAPDAE